MQALILQICDTHMRLLPFPGYHPGEKALFSVHISFPEHAGSASPQAGDSSEEEGHEGRSRSCFMTCFWKARQRELSATGMQSTLIWTSIKLLQ